LFASRAINDAGANGLFYGNPKQFLIQAIGVLVCAGYVFVVTFLIYKLVDVFFGIRVKEKEEMMGLDLTQHHESAYTMLE
jgi:Amt family ammonium transporter